MLRKLAAPGIVRAEDLAVIRGQTILVMQCVQGPARAHLIEASGPIASETFLWIALGTTEAPHNLAHREEAARHPRTRSWSEPSTFPIT